ncbi:translation initiation inhibitor protein [Nitratireductor indicus C115]|uniref:Translation initiation inhibitor protein n=1 Tax=Nitratireductor indicus C115 TaxID=1231190 RepID=K2NYK5_9HYPH|nr:RidA family protein [Nitratireductor indicus]EKF40136.1 translation initiation inhibitor protein [Nitratireductor indicus C115]SFQ81355.1 Enamine deaminase RidA, house cleaning of reactive enamine intermediates, YjgF/YER057c/UK114 family [Nitratireductor indicus]
MSPYDRLAAMGLELPPVRKAAGAYVPARLAGGLMFLSGRGGAGADGKVVSGRVGETVSTAEAHEHARSAGLQLLAAAHVELGDLARIKAVVKLLGMVNAVPGYREHPKVIDGCSELFLSVLGEAGRHARSAVGVGSLPHDMTVEVEAILLVDA